MSTNHTPGPWAEDVENPLLIRSSGKKDDVQIIVANCSLETYRLACNTVGDMKTLKLVNKWEKANAKLIATSPELLIDNMEWMQIHRQLLLSNIIIPKSLSDRIIEQSIKSEKTIKKATE